MSSEAPIISNVQRAAVMIMLLGDDEAAAILGKLAPNEIQRIGETMVAMGEVGPEAVAHAVSDFVERAEKAGMAGQDRTGHFRALMTRAVGELKASSVMQRIAPASNTPSLDLARWLSPEVIAPMIESEHPQAIAVLLLQLDAEVAAKVLHALPGDVQTQVVHRVATLGPVAPEALLLLEELLDRRIREQHGHGALSMGGPKEAADIINAAAKAVEKRVMPEIAKNDKWWTDPKRDAHVAAYTKQGLFSPTLPYYYIYNPAYAEVWTDHVWNTAFHDIVSGGMSPKQAADKGWKRAEDIFAKYPIEQA